MICQHSKHSKRKPAIAGSFQKKKTGVIWSLAILKSGFFATLSKTPSMQLLSSRYGETLDLGLPDRTMAASGTVLPTGDIVFIAGDG